MATSSQDLTYIQAKEILNKNSYEVAFAHKKLRHVVPSREYYIHQWKWDSAVHAMGLLHLDETWAFDEIISLLSGQWQNGFIGHITFNPEEEKYFPGPKYWGTHTKSTNGILSSGITQPPLITLSVLYLYKHAKNKKKADIFIREVLPAITKYHEYLKKYRDPENCGLVSVLHPWESGADNSPRWDSLLQRINIKDIPKEVKVLVDTYRVDHKTGTMSDRPSNDDYYRYMHLIFLYKKANWDYSEIVKETPFAVKDILFNSIWCRANEALAEIYTLLDKKREAKLYEEYATQTKIALQNSWDEQTCLFTDIDVTQGRWLAIKENTNATFGPLFAGAVTKQQMPKLLAKIVDPMQYWTDCPVPTTSFNNKKFELTRYWRGPTMPMTNFLIIEGLSRYKKDIQCLNIRDALIQKTIQMIEKYSFYEYYDPLSDKNSFNVIRSGRGFGTFSWTAAIYIYLCHEYPHIINSQ